MVFTQGEHSVMGRDSAVLSQNSVNYGMVQSNEFMRREVRYKEIINDLKQQLESQRVEMERIKDHVKTLFENNEEEVY